ncbi:MAG: hypothetical protein VX593_10895 [Pseudomonadota bacterium]|nr:hypothetical protein [Pseudomonadota bacterium]
MLRKLILPLGACASLWLAACQPADPAKADVAACMTLLGGDEDIGSDLADYGSSLEGYCDCYAATLASSSEAQQDATRRVVAYIGGIRTSGDVSLEEAAQEIEDIVEGRLEDDSIELTEAQFEQAGRIIEGVRRDLRDNDGKCSATAS